MIIAVGMSGGVDSSVAALLLKEQGCDVVGVTMKLWNGKYKGGDRDACFGAGEDKDIEDAAAIARSLGIEYRVFDCSAEYDRTIVSYFRETYLDGKTPNPCVFCNAMMKFGLLPRLAREAGLKFDRFATGHYARSAEIGGRHAILRAKDISKDQSYFLYRLSQEQIARHVFPLGRMMKSEVREIARAHGIASADKPDSQDFYSGEKEELIGEKDRPGDIVDLSGKVLARHSGFWRFTVGQRKGLGIGGGGVPYYVVAIDPCKNRVVVGSEEDAKSGSFRVKDVNWVSMAPTAEPFRCKVKVRSMGNMADAEFKDGECRFDGKVLGVAPGQSAVVYSPDGETLLCGGIIA